MEEGTNHRYPCLHSPFLSSASSSTLYPAFYGKYFLYRLYFFVNILHQKTGYEKPQQWGSPSLVVRRKPAKKDLLSSQRASLLLIKGQEEKEQQRRNEKGKEKDSEEADFERVIPTTRRRGETVGQEIVDPVFAPPPDENDEESPKDNNNTTTTVTTTESGVGAWSSIKKSGGPRRSLSLFNTNYFMYSSPVKNVKEFFMMQAPDPTRELHLVGEQFMISAKELVADGKYKDAFGFFEQGEEKYRNVVSTYADLKDAEVCKASSFNSKDLSLCSSQNRLK